MYPKVHFHTSALFDEFHITTPSSVGFTSLPKFMHLQNRFELWGRDSGLLESKRSDFSSKDGNSRCCKGDQYVSNKLYEIKH